MGNSASMTNEKPVSVVLANNLEEISASSPQFSLNTIYVQRGLDFGSEEKDIESNMNNAAILSANPADHQEQSSIPKPKPS